MVQIVGDIAFMRGIGLGEAGLTVVMKPPIILLAASAASSTRACIAFSNELFCAKQLRISSSDWGIGGNTGA